MKQLTLNFKFELTKEEITSYGDFTDVQVSKILEKLDCQEGALSELFWEIIYDTIQQTCIDLYPEIIK
jgi:hypothetical protein